MNKKSVPISLELLLKNLLITVMYTIVGRIFDSLATEGIVSAVYPPTGIAVAALLWWGYRILPGIWLGSFLEIFSMTQYFIVSAWGGLTEIASCFFSVWLLLKLTKTNTPFYRAYDLAIFIFGTTIVGAFINSFGSLGLLVYGVTKPDQFYISWFDWWSSTAVGIITMVPLIMSWYKPKKIAPHKFPELLGLFALFALSAWLEYQYKWPARILLIYCIWATFRFNLQTTTIMCFFYSLVTFHQALQGIHEFQGANINQTILYTQSFVTMIFLIPLMLIAVLSEREKAQLELLDTNRNLEGLVIERTNDLANKNSMLKNTLSELKEAQSQLVQAEKMSALGTLTAGIAHEINNSVNFISANMNPLKRDIEDISNTVKKYRGISIQQLEKEWHEVTQSITDTDLNFTLNETNQLLKGMEEGIQRTTGIVQDLRTFTRLDEGAFKKTNIHENIDSTLNLLKSYFQDSITIVKNYGDIPEIECQPGKINQVLMNLLNNAIQATPDKGTIVITTAQINQEISISIKDSGIGMTEDIKAKIFEPFFTTKDVGKGTGLGLSISYGIIQEHHGSISVVSEPDKGSEFILKLPIVHTAL